MVHPLPLVFSQSDAKKKRIQHDIFSMTHTFKLDHRKFKSKILIPAKLLLFLEVSKGTNIRNRYNQVPHLTQETNGKVTNSQLYTTNKSQEVRPFPAGDHKAKLKRRTQRHNLHKTVKT